MSNLLLCRDSKSFLLFKAVSEIDSELSKEIDYIVQGDAEYTDKNLENLIDSSSIDFFQREKLSGSGK